MDPGHDLLVFPGGEGQLSSATTSGYEHEKVPSHRAQRQNQIPDRREISLVVAGNRGVDLKGKVRFPGIFQGLKGLIEAPPHLAKEIMDLSVGTIKAHGNPLDAAGHHLLNDLGGDAGAAG